MAQGKYKRRKEGIYLKRTTTPQRYMKDTHIPWLWEQMGLPMDNKPKLKISKRKAKNDTDIMMRWFYPYLERRSWENLQTSAFGRGITTHLRRHISDITISSYLGILNRFMRQAEIDGFVIRTKIDGIPALAQSDGNDEHSYASAIDEMMHILSTHSEMRMKAALRKDITSNSIISVKAH